MLAGVRALNRGVNGVFMTEGVSLGIGSCLFAIPVSYPITNLVASAIGPMATGSPWTGTFTATGVLIWIVIILSLLANYIPARNASRLTVR